LLMPQTGFYHKPPVAEEVVPANAGTQKGKQLKNDID